MDYLPLCPSDDMEDTITNPYIPLPTKVSGKPQCLPLLILTPQSMPILPSQSQQIMGYNQQKHYAPHCLPPVTPTNPFHTQTPTFPHAALPTGRQLTETLRLSPS